MGVHHNSGSSYGGRTNSSGGSSGGISTGISVDAKEVLVKLDRLRAGHPERDKALRKIIATCIAHARSKVLKDSRSNMPNDPRKAYKAVRSSNYKRVYGGQINILNPRKAVRSMAIYRKERTLKPGQWGGNRRKVSDRTKQVDAYFGADRAFIQRFTNLGTTVRETRYGSRGRIGARDWFGISSTIHMQDAVSELSDLLDEATERLWNH